MFESSLLTTLTGDTTLTDLLNTFTIPGTVNARPAVFANQAPKKAKVRYIVFNIAKYEGGSVAVDRFNVFIDIFDYGHSSANVTTAAFRVEYLLDQKSITHDRFFNIRFYRHSYGFVNDPGDPRDIHYNMQFDARADRKGWMSQF